MWFPSAGFPHLATANPTVPPKFPALETWEKPHKCFPRVSKPGNSQPDNSTSFPCIGNFGETYREFLRVFTKVNSQTWGSHSDPLHGKLMDTYVIADFHTLPGCFQNVIFKVIITFKVIKMTIIDRCLTRFFLI